MSEPRRGGLTLRELQERTEKVLARVAHPRVLAPLALLEEAGELARVILEHEGYGQALDGKKLEGELADLVVAASELASRYGIDLEAALARKLEDLAARAPGWEQKYGPSLERARRRLDLPPS